MNTAKLITIEGVEGVGKSTAVAAIRSVLDEAKLPYIATREPGGSHFAEEIRDLLLKHGDETVYPMTELLLMFACREQNIQEIIRPALKAGKWVISDRFTDASFAYQGGGRGLPRARIQALSDWVQADVTPAITILLDADVEIGLARLKGDKDRIEQEDIDFFKRVRQVYLDLAAAEPQRYRIVSAEQSLEVVEAEVKRIISKLIAVD